MHKHRFHLQIHQMICVHIWKRQHKRVNTHTKKTSGSQQRFTLLPKLCALISLVYTVSGCVHVYKCMLVVYIMDVYILQAPKVVFSYFSLGIEWADMHLTFHPVCKLLKKNNIIPCRCNLLQLYIIWWWCQTQGTGTVSISAIITVNNALSDAFATLITEDASCSCQKMWRVKKNVCCCFKKSDAKRRFVSDQRRMKK